MGRYRTTFTYKQLAERMIQGTRLKLNDDLKYKSQINYLIKHRSQGTKTLAKKLGIAERAVRQFKNYYSASDFIGDGS